jgi:hypothetical protein
LYLSDGLRKDEAQFMFDPTARLMEASRKHGVPQAVLEMPLGSWSPFDGWLLTPMRRSGTQGRHHGPCRNSSQSSRIGSHHRMRGGRFNPSLKPPDSPPQQAQPTPTDSPR